MHDAGQEALAWPDDAIEVGCITDAWGVKGWFKVKPFSSDPQALFSSRRWFVRAPESVGPGASVKLSGLPPLLKIVAVKNHGDGVVAQAQDVVHRRRKAVGGVGRQGNDDDVEECCCHKQVKHQCGGKGIGAGAVE